MTVAIEATSLGLEAAKPVYGTLRQIYKTKKDKKQFLDIIEIAGVHSGMSEEVAGRVREAMSAEMEAALKRSATRLKRATWRLRFDRGPGVDGLPTLKLKQWLDDMYRQAILKQAIKSVPESISEHFWMVLGDAFEPEQPAGRTAYARRLLNALERNDREHKSYLATTTVVASGIAGAGVTGALADGVSGAADADLKTALAVLAGITITTLLGTLIRALENRLSPRQPASRQSDELDIDRIRVQNTWTKTATELVVS